MIRKATPRDHEALKALWMAAFGDSRNATDFYFEHRHKDEWMLVEEEEGQLRAMLSSLPIALRSPSGAQQGRYLFALATDERFRGQGIGGRLMLYAEEEAKKAGCLACALVPATPSLFQFYSERGYAPCFDYKLLQVQAEDLPAPDDGDWLYQPSGRQMLALRDEAFGDSRLYARWDEDALSFVKKAAQVYGAALFAFEKGSAKGYVYGEWEDDTLIVKDFPLIGIQPLPALALLHAAIGAKRYVLRLRPDSDQGEIRPFGMIKAFGALPQEGAAPYLSFAKD